MTGGAGALGRAVIDALLALPRPPAVIGMDTPRRHVPGAVWRAADVRDPTLASQLAGVGTVVHLATDRSTTTDAAERRAINGRGTEVLLAACESAGVSRVVLLTSAMVYGARATNPVPLDEDAPVLADADGLVGDWLAMEHAAAASPLDVTVVRPASLVGDVSDSLLPGLFEAVRLLAIRDARCHWQLCHVEDVVAALVAAALGDVTGAVTVGCEGWLDREAVERISGLRSVVVPWSVARVTASRLYRVGALSSPPSDLQYLAEPWVVGSQRLRAAGWAPRWDNEAALREHLRMLGPRVGRGLLIVDRKDATRAAAGATLAVIGSLALARARSARRP